MPVTNYHTVDGQMVGETTNGVRTDYFPDALGSVVMTASGGAQRNRYEQAPYGGSSKISGSDPDPRFLWVGTYGYRTTGMTWSDYYVRARHYDSFSARWTTVDPFWPVEERYLYVAGNPIGSLDASGLQSNKVSEMILKDIEAGAMRCGFGSQDAGAIAILLLCIARGESSFDSGTFNNLFSINQRQYGLYEARCCKERVEVKGGKKVRIKPRHICHGITDPKTNMRAFWWLLVTQCLKYPGKTIHSVLAAFMGVLPGTREDSNTSPYQQNEQTMKCLEEFGFVTDTGKRCKDPDLIPRRRPKTDPYPHIYERHPSSIVLPPSTMVYIRCQKCDPCL